MKRKVARLRTNCHICEPGPAGSGEASVQSRRARGLGTSWGPDMQRHPLSFRLLMDGGAARGLSRPDLKEVRPHREWLLLTKVCILCVSSAKLLMLILLFCLLM